MNGKAQAKLYAGMVKRAWGPAPGSLVDIPILGRCQVVRVEGTSLVVQTRDGDEITVSRNIATEVRR